MTSKQKRSPKDGPALKTGGRDARKLGALILQVLAGELRPTEAAEVLGVGLPRYYQLEKQALEGFLAGCEPKEKGRQCKTAEKQLEETVREKRRLERDLLRAQALLRASHKAAGLAAIPEKTTAGGRKRRKPEIRAHKIARNLGKGLSEEPVSDLLNESSVSIDLSLSGKTESESAGGQPLKG